MNEVLLSTAAARETVWLHHCDHFVLGTVGSDTTHLRRDWSKEELAAHETWFQQEAEEASEGEAMRIRYKLELRPGMARTGTRVGGSDDGWHYGQFAVVDTQTGQDAALFYVNYVEEEKSPTRGFRSTRKRARRSPCLFTSRAGRPGNICLHLTAAFRRDGTC